MRIRAAIAGTKTEPNDGPAASATARTNSKRSFAIRAVHFWKVFARAVAAVYDRRTTEIPALIERHYNKTHLRIMMRQFVSCYLA
jgi:hypothetical protein